VGYVIWSIEHNAWWAAGRQGYTRELPQAGIYGEDESRDIVERANAHRATSYECRIPVECTLPTGAPAGTVGDQLEALERFKDALERHFGFGNGGARR
jgi:hypothetical protein